MMGSTKQSGVYVNENRFTAVVPFGWVLDHTISGTVLESALREAQSIEDGTYDQTRVVMDERTLSIARAREKMQRPFQIETSKQRIRGGKPYYVRTLKPTRKYENAKGPLKNYLVNAIAATNGSGGILPSFFLYWPELLPSDELDHAVDLFSGIGWYSYSFDPIKVGRGAILDGECRVEAGLLVRADNKIAHSVRDQLMRCPVTIEVFHGIPTERAAQYFIDLNTKAVPVDRTTEANIDPRNKWINVTKQIFDELGVSLATTGRQLTSAHVANGQHLLLTHAAQMVKSMAIGGAQATRKSSDRESAWEGVDFVALKRGAIQWFRVLLDHFDEGEAIFHSDAYVVRASPIRLALGELGEGYYLKDPEKCRKAKAVLEEVSWQVSEAWNGLAGVVKVSKNGNLRLSGMSGRNYRPAYNAMVNETSRNGRAIRGAESDA